MCYLGVSEKPNRKQGKNTHQISPSNIIKCVAGFLLLAKGLLFSIFSLWLQSQKASKGAPQTVVATRRKINMEVWKIIFLSEWVIWRFHVNVPGCIETHMLVICFCKHKMIVWSVSYYVAILGSTSIRDFHLVQDDIVECEDGIPDKPKIYVYVHRSDPSKKRRNPENKSLPTIPESLTPQRHWRNFGWYQAVSNQSHPLDWKFSTCLSLLVEARLKIHSLFPCCNPVVRFSWRGQSFPSRHWMNRHCLQKLHQLGLQFRSTVLLWTFWRNIYKTWWFMLVSYLGILHQPKNQQL